MKAPDFLLIKEIFVNWSKPVVTRLRLRDKYYRRYTSRTLVSTFAHENKKNEVRIKFQNKKDKDPE